MLAVPPRQELRIRPLETNRLILSPIDTSDARDLWAAVDASRAHLEPWLPWVPFNIDAEASFRYAEASAADWDNARACRFGIRDRIGRRLVGVVGLEAFAHLHQSVELGYWLRSDACGKGFMTEAARATIDWALHTLQCAPHPRRGSDRQPRLARRDPASRLSLRGDRAASRALQRAVARSRGLRAGRERPTTELKGATPSPARATSESPPRSARRTSIDLSRSSGRPRRGRRRGWAGRGRRRRRLR